MTLKRSLLPAILMLVSFTAIAQSYSNIEFIENNGQWDKKVKFKGEVNAGAFFIRSTGFTVLQNDTTDYRRMREMIHQHSKTEGAAAASRDQPITIKAHAYAVDFLDASPKMEIAPDKAIDTYNNYIIGNDPSKWGTKCRIFQGITLKNVYDNVDVRYYTDKGSLKYDLIIKPGADISKIALKYDGADKLEVKNKELRVSTSVGMLRESSPYSYKTDGKQRTEVSVKYVVKDNVVRFKIDNYDPTATLVIDPVFIFCSFTGSTADNWGFSATYGPDGSTFGGGIVFNTGFPVTTGAFQTTFGGGNGEAPSGSGIDIGIIKLSPSGNNKLYATYLGGITGNELPQSLICDAQGNLIVAGRSNSTDYPVTGGAAGLIGPGGGWDIIVTKLNATGTALIGSKKIGGDKMDGGNITSGSNGENSLNRNYGDEARSEVIIDAANNIYVASCTQSINFPVSATAFQKEFGNALNHPGLQDGVVLKFNSNVSSLLFSTFLGGSDNDAAYVLAPSPSGDIYVGGGTSSVNFPGNHAGTIGAALTVPAKTPADIDGFVARIKNDGTAIINSTYLGTTGFDQVYGLKFDQSGFPYVMGQTTGAWPIINANFSNNNAKQFIAKLQPDLSAYVYSTVFGTSSAVPNISPVAFLVDRCENVYVSGWGGATDNYNSAGPQGMPVTSGAIKSISRDNADFYFFVLKKNAAVQLYGSFFGQDGGWTDHVDGGTSRFDQNGVIYEAMCANCGGGVTFPTTPGAYATVKPASAFCNLAMVKIAFNLAGVGADVQSQINGVPKDTAGCLPLDVTFTDQIRNAESYEWDFGDGTHVGPLPAATGYTQQHTYTAVGLYEVLLIAIDPNSCNIRDTSRIHIRVGNLKANLAATFAKLPPCEGFIYNFDNTGSNTDISRPFQDTSFVWDFGDGSPRVITGLTNNLQHTYPGPGTYKGFLILKDTAYCNNPDSIPLTISVAANVVASFTTPPTGCAPYNAIFNNTSVGGQTYEWTFGDGGTSTDMSPEHLYTAPGPYHIRLVAFNDNTCNKTDTTYFDIQVFSKPAADFSFSPQPPLENTPTVFTNLSSPDAVSFRWNFGDGDTLRTNSRAPVTHQYNETGTFTACLTAFNTIGCDSTLCHQVRTLIRPLVDVPNAFTPQSGDVNNVIMVKGYGIAKMRFIIYNRWGQKVFETSNRLQGWDGRVKGVVQPLDVYVYTLDVEFFDGNKTTKKGDITLIR